MAGVLSHLWAGGPDALRRVKGLLRGVASRLGGDRDELARYTSSEIAAARGGAEGREGTSAFFERRPPSWNPPDPDTGTQ